MSKFTAEQIADALADMGLNEDGSVPLLSEYEVGRLAQHFTERVVVPTIGARGDDFREHRLRRVLELVGLPFDPKNYFFQDHLRTAPASLYRPIFQAIREVATWHPPITVDADGFDVVREKPLTGTKTKLVLPREIPPRDWLYAGHYLRGTVSADVAPGGGGKSINAQTEAMSMATMKDILMTGAMYWRPLRVWYINLEENKNELLRRQAAIWKWFSESHTDDEATKCGGIFASKGLLADARQLLEENLWLDSSETLGKAFKLAKFDNESRSVKIVEPLVNEVIAFIKANGIDQLIVDPTVSSHDIPSENDNVAIDHLIKDAYKVIAERGNCGVHLTHHTPKMHGKQVTAEDLRGASAMFNAVRTARAFNLMSDQDAEEYDISEREDYFCLRNGKPNYQRRGGRPVWRRMVPVDLGNKNDNGQHDIVGVPTAWEPPVKSDIEVAEENDKRRTDILALIDKGKTVTRSQGGNFTLKDLAKDWRTSPVDLRLTLDQMEKEGIVEYHIRRPGDRRPAGYYRVSKPSA